MQALRQNVEVRIVTLSPIIADAGSWDSTPGNQGNATSFTVRTFSMVLIVCRCRQARRSKLAESRAQDDTDVWSYDETKQIFGVGNMTTGEWLRRVTDWL